MDNGNDALSLSNRGLILPAGESAKVPSLLGQFNKLLGTTALGGLAWLDRALFKGDKGNRGDTGLPGLNGGTASNLSIGTFASAAGQNLTAGGNSPAPELVATSAYRPQGILASPRGGANYLLWQPHMAALPVPPVGVNAWWFEDSKGNRYYPDPNRLTFGQFGAYADYVRTGDFTGTVGHDDYPAWLAYRAFCEWYFFDFDNFGTNIYRSLPPLHVELGNYYFSDTLEVEFGQITVVGATHSAVNGGSGVVFNFADGKTGVRVQHWLTSEETGDTTQPAHLTGAGSEFRNIFLWSNGHGGSTTADGWRIRAPGVRLINCSAKGFIRHGLHLSADTSVSSGALVGNANQFYIQGGYYSQNGVDGLFLDGYDGNAGVVTYVNSQENGRWGINESSFLGNLILGCHTMFNGLRTITGPRYQRTTVGAWCVHPVSGTMKLWNVLRGREADAAVTPPGTNEAIWKFIRNEAAASPAAPLWVSGMQFQAGGGYASDDVTGRGGFFSCYGEGDQPMSQFAQGARIVGGIHANGYVGGADDYAYENKLASSAFMARKFHANPAGLTKTDGSGPIDNITTSVIGGKDFFIHEASHTNANGTGLCEAGYQTKFAGAGDQVVMVNANADALLMMYYGGANSQFRPNNRSADVHHYFGFPTLYLGKGPGARACLGSRDTIPDAGEGGIGDYVRNSNPTAGGYAEWVKTAAGWKTANPVSA
jgi:hypothetical protein